MVRLVFRPYTQVRRSICTSEPLRTSTRVSSGFVLLRHSSPSFGSQRIRSSSAPSQAIGTGLCCVRASRSHGSHISHRADLHFHCAFGFSHPMTRAYAKLLGPCFKTGRIDDQLLHRDRAMTRPANTDMQHQGTCRMRPPPDGQPSADQIRTARLSRCSSRNQSLHGIGYHTEEQASNASDPTAAAAQSQRTPLANAPTVQRRQPQRRPEQINRTQPATDSS